MTASAGGSRQEGPVVELDGVTRRYRTSHSSVTAVDQISLTVRPGEIVGVSGPSGCGKSTLLRLAAGLERPDEGEVRYRHQAAWPRQGRWQRRHGGQLATYPRPGYVMAVFQDPFASVDVRWPLWRTVTEPLTVRRGESAGSGGRRLSRTDRRQEAEVWLERAGLASVSPEARPAELSGGQCQRLALARALVAEPALLVADEPTARQDVVTAAAMTRLLREAADRGIALVVVSHDAAWLDLLADRVMPLSAAT